MRHFLVNLLPPEVGDRVRSRGEARRTGLLIALLLLSLVGVSVHSWDQARRARAVRDAAASLRDSAGDVEAELARLEVERTRLQEFMTTYRRVALPIEMSDLLATIVNRMPQKATLTDLSLRLVARETAPVRTSAPPGATAPPAPPPKRVLEIRLRGFAASINEVSDFERSLAATAPLAQVALSENRSLQTPDGDFHEFVITAEVDLDRPYTGLRATGPLAHRAGASHAAEKSP